MVICVSVLTVRYIYYTTLVSYVFLCSVMILLYSAVLSRVTPQPFCGQADRMFGAAGGPLGTRARNTICAR